jgi:hypothetical protein
MSLRKIQSQLARFRFIVVARLVRASHDDEATVVGQSLRGMVLDGRQTAKRAGINPAL